MYAHRTVEARNSTSATMNTSGDFPFRIRSAPIMRIGNSIMELLKVPWVRVAIIAHPEKA